MSPRADIRESARIKLATFGLDRLLDLDAGAYGTDDDIRANLVEIARQRAIRAHRVRFGPDTTILIGDTPNDVRTARDAHARIIAVASANDTRDDLAAAGAGTVLPDLTDTAALLAAIDANTHDRDHPPN